MNIPTPVSLNRRWAKALESDTASVARDLMNLGLSPHDVIDGDVVLVEGTPKAIRPKSLWRWAARASGSAALEALVPGVEMQWTMRPNRRQASFVDGFEHPPHSHPTEVVRLHNASPGLLPTRSDGWALDEALIWTGDETVRKLVWLNQQLQTWAGSMDWDATRQAPWDGSVGDRTTFLRHSWVHALLNIGDRGAWCLLAFERLGIVHEDQWDLPIKNPDAGNAPTLLQEAARLAQTDLVRSLLQQRTDPNLATHQGHTPLGLITAHLLQSPEQRLPGLVEAWIDLLSAGAALSAHVPVSKTRPSAQYHPGPGEWVETAPNNQWMGNSIENAIDAWLTAQAAPWSEGSTLDVVDGFRRTEESIALAGRLGRALEGHRLRQTWALHHEADPASPKPAVG